MKKNQGNLYKRVDELFQEVLVSGQPESEYNTYSLDTLGHGRTENRHYQVFNNIQEQVNPKQEWSKLSSVVHVEYLRQLKNGKTKQKNRYFLNSLSNSAEQLADYIRGYWSIENQLHWGLDVEFLEDNSCIKKDNAPENLAVIRHIAINLLKQNKSFKGSIKSKRNRAGWDERYLREILLN